MMHALYIALLAYGVMTVTMTLGLFLDLDSTPLGGRLLRTFVMGVIWPYFIVDNIWHWWRRRRYKRKRDRMRKYQEPTSAGISLKYNPLMDDDHIFPPLPRKYPVANPKTGKIDLKYDPLYCSIDICGRLPRRGDSLESAIRFEEMCVPTYEDAEKTGHCGNGGKCRCLVVSHKRIAELRERLKNGETSL